MWLDNLKEMKKVSGKTSKQIADETKEPKSTIDKLFSGNTKEPRLSLVMKVVHCLGFSLDELNSEVLKTTVISEHEREVLLAYRRQPSMQDAVDKLLGVEKKEEENKKRA